MGKTIKVFSFIIIALLITSCAEKEPTPSRVDSLISTLVSEEDYERSNAAYMLGEISHTLTPSERKAATDALLDGLFDESPEVRSAAGYAMGQFVCTEGEEWRNYLSEAIPSLLVALQDESPQVREMAAYALLFIGPDGKSAIPGLIKALDDESMEVVKSVADALGNMGPVAAEALPKLKELANDESYGTSKHHFTNAIKRIEGD
jgi:HEAT repeat protein